jgi:hypothetical protein
MLFPSAERHNIELKMSLKGEWIGKVAVQPRYPERTSYDHAQHQNTNTHCHAPKTKHCLTNIRLIYTDVEKITKLGDHIIADKGAGIAQSV